MRGLFVTSGFPPAELRDGCFDKVAVELAADALPLLAAARAAAARVGVWDPDPHPDHIDALLALNPDEVILQAEGSADPILQTVAALRPHWWGRLLSIVTNLNPSRTNDGFDRVMHHNNVRLLVEVYRPDTPALIWEALLAEAHWRGYPHAQPVLGCYRGYGLKDYQPLPQDYWIWEAGQMPEEDWQR